MKKRKALKRVSLVALSAVMVSGIALAATACGNSGGDPTTISVYIFCNKSDEYTNNTICRKWETEYSKAINREVKVQLTTTTDKDGYFEGLRLAWSNPKSVQDIIYLSPKYVQSYARAGYVMDLSEYLDAESADKIDGVWSNAIDYYGYSTTAQSYTPGQKIEYRANGANGAGYYTATGDTKVGLYGLPKDYSNFSMGYNRRYFSKDLKLAYEKTKGSTARNVTNASLIAGTNGATTKFEGYSATNKNNFVATFAADGEYTLSDGTKATATKGEEAPLIAIGVPVTYKPFNFYRYNDFESALAAGDPTAVMIDEISPDGYTVTMPGFPGDTFEIDTQTNAKATNVPYDATLGHTVFTYAEYGALVWAVTYYLNTFAWSSSDPTSGSGGLTSGSNPQAIYGSEQYEGAQGNALYLLPWAASNDADFINENSTKCSNDGTNGAKYDTTSLASELGGTTAEKRAKINLDGTTRNADVQYGVNSKNFIETYGAFQEFGSTWNGNSGNAGDEATAKQSVSGWDYFRTGAAVFYGAGTWDAATRNDTEMSVFEFGQMPCPVSERLALYSEVKDADYNVKEYSNSEAAKGTGDNANHDYDQRTNPSEGKKVYTKEQIELNQIKRQDKWAARMDSVGYAANGRFANLSEDDPEYWKREATASLIQALTIGEEEQVTLTYAGAQLPNYRGQCSDFLYYQRAGFENGDFKDMITPEGFADTTDATTGRAIWDHYYTIAKAMAADSLPQSANRNKTVSEWITQSSYKDFDGTSAVRYDQQYANVKLNEFTGENGTNIAFAMKVLRMVCFTYAERDLNIRMQYGLNSVRDSSMYTANNTWIASLNASSNPAMFAYVNQRSLTTEERQGVATRALIADTMGKRQANGTAKGMWTPAVYCINMAGTMQTSLNATI